MLPEQGDTQDDLTQNLLSLNCHLTSDVQLTLSTWLPVTMSTESFHDHHRHCQEAYTEVLSVNPQLYGTRQAAQPLPQIKCKKN